MPSPQTVQPARQMLLFGGAGDPGGSQVSPGVLPRMPSPHTGSSQTLVQPSVLVVLPSSHCSPSFTIPSPQTVQSPRQGMLWTPAGVPGGSHVSPGVLPTMPSAHTGSRQVFVQP